jgi:hypothetical protein
LQKAQPTTPLEKFRFIPTWHPGTLLTPRKLLVTVPDANTDLGGFTTPISPGSSGFCVSVSQTGLVPGAIPPTTMVCLVVAGAELAGLATEAVAAGREADEAELVDEEVLPELQAAAQIVTATATAADTRVGTDFNATPGSRNGIVPILSVQIAGVANAVRPDQPQAPGR